MPEQVGVTYASYSENENYKPLVTSKGLENIAPMKKTLPQKDTKKFQAGTAYKC